MNDAVGSSVLFCSAELICVVWFGVLFDGISLTIIVKTALLIDCIEPRVVVGIGALLGRICIVWNKVLSSKELITMVGTGVSLRDTYVTCEVGIAIRNAELSVVGTEVLFCGAETTVVVVVGIVPTNTELIIEVGVKI